MHEIQTGRNCITRSEVISHWAAHVDSKRDVLSLRIFHPVGSLGVEVPDAEASVQVGRDRTPTRDKITSNTHDVREVPALRSPRNRGNRPGERHVPIAAQNPGTFYAVYLPP